MMRIALIGNPGNPILHGAWWALGSSTLWSSPLEEPGATTTMGLPAGWVGAW